MDEFLNAFLGMQIKTLREQREWTQNELGLKADMKQTRISVLESMDYSAWSLDVLRRLAKAFDLRLVVKFEDFGSYVKNYFEFDRENLKRRSFGNDIIFNSEERDKSIRFLASHETLNSKQSDIVSISRTRRRKTQAANNVSKYKSDLPFDILGSKVAEDTSSVKDVKDIKHIGYEEIEQRADTEPTYYIPTQDYTGTNAQLN